MDEIMPAKPSAMKSAKIWLARMIKEVLLSEEGVPAC